MAAIGLGRFRPALKLPFSSKFWCGERQCPRYYSVFSPAFKEPVSSKEEIEKIVNEKLEEELLAIKVKPASNNQTCSVFYHPDVERLINYSMSKGNKRISRDIVRAAFTRVKHIQLRKYNTETDEEKKQNIIINPVKVFLLAIKNVTPVLWYLRIKKSGSWYKIPVGIPEDRGRRLAMKWLVEAANEGGKNLPYKVKLANELVDAAHYTGKAVGKKIEMHKMCEANRGIAHYWWT